ncbi:MAG: hypothetical protein IJX78_06515 [Bacilli bacterium]|nr:hypothetical protein [Bacilli bacterium]
MSKLIDRLSTNSNRRKLKVIDITKEDSELKELIVDIERDDFVENDGQIGTKLNAENLKNAISELVDEIILTYDLKNNDGSNNDVTINTPTISTIVLETDKTVDYWIQSSSNVYSNTFRITSVNGEPIYAKVLSEDTNDKIKVGSILKNGTRQVVINVAEDLNSNGINGLDWVTVSKNFVIGVYSDEKFTELVKEITYTVHYTFNSGDPYVETLYSLNGTELYLSGELRTSSFFLATENEEKLYARVLNKSDDTSVSFEDNGTTVVRVNVTISPIEGANVTTTYEVTIEVFNSDSYTTKLGEITLVVYYSPNSTDPID